jgi:hypothetical protein
MAKRREVPERVIRRIILARSITVMHFETNTSHRA